MASAMSCDAAMSVVSAASVCDSGSGRVIVSGVVGGGVGFEMCCIFVAGQLWFLRFSGGEPTAYVSYLTWELLWLRFSKGVEKT